MPLLRRGGVNLVAGFLCLANQLILAGRMCTHDAGCFANIAIGLPFPLALKAQQATIGLRSRSAPPKFFPL